MNLQSQMNLQNLMPETIYTLTSEYEERTAEFSEKDAGKRLDAALAEYFPDLSRTRIQTILKNNQVYPCGLTGSMRVKAGDKVAIMVNERVPLAAFPEDIEINVVYEDKDILVVDKERGMVVHPAKGNTSGTLVNALLGRYRADESALSGINGQIRPGIVHRIDKNTSGLLVVAKNDEAHRSLAEQFAAHTIKRSYTGIVTGGFKDNEGTINKPIGRDQKNRVKMAVLQDGRPAVTHWRALEKLGAHPCVFTLMEFELETGRTHQIRVHMADAGHPLLGDDIYGCSKGPAAGEGQYLHAQALGFRHPASGEEVLFESPPPGYFTEMLAKLRQPPPRSGTKKSFC